MSLLKKEVKDYNNNNNNLYFNVSNVNGNVVLVTFCSSFSHIIMKEPFSWLFTMLSPHSIACVCVCVCVHGWYAWTRTKRIECQ